MESIAGDDYLIEKIFLPLIDENTSVWMSEAGFSRYDVIYREFLDYWDGRLFPPEHLEEAEAA